MHCDPDSVTIHYQLCFSDGHRVEHTVVLDAAPDVQAGESWTRLGFHQCAHCPLDAAVTPHCPFAIALAKPARLVGQRASYETVAALVRWRSREIRQQTTLQRALGSLLGAICAASACPHTRPLKAMVRFHLPFSTSDETLYRVLGTYLLGQYLRSQRSLVADWNLAELRATYRNLRDVNAGMAKRLRAAAEEDSSINGLVLLDLLAADTLDSLDHYEGQLDGYFAEYLED